MTTVLLLAHGNGWDETAFILTPVALFGGLLAVANKRARAMASKERPLPTDTLPAAHQPGDTAADHHPESAP